MAATLRLRSYLPQEAAYHVARVRLRPPERIQPHRHDFAELFWIERGRGSHLVNGEQHDLAEGDLWLMRPDDIHAFRACDERGFTQLNVAFASDTLDVLRDRYFDAGEGPLQSGALPATHRLGGADLGWLDELSALLFAGPPSRLLLERFLLDLLHRLVAPPAASALPLWAEEALERWREDPAARARGVPALAELAGRSREHVNRVIRQRTGKTATALIQQIRLDHAAAQLRMSDTPLARVAIDSGLLNLSHFHRLFKDRFGVTPRAYRLRHQAVVRGESVRTR
jgi:AraC family cel operon transcriptional repressor